MIEYEKYLPRDLSPELEALVMQLAAPMDVGPGTEHDGVQDQLEQLSLDHICAPSDRRSDDMAHCCVAGLWLACGWRQIIWNVDIVWFRTWLGAVLLIGMQLCIVVNPIMEIALIGLTKLERMRFSAVTCCVRGGVS